MKEREVWPKVSWKATRGLSGGTTLLTMLETDA
jgi:hypothetical protein